MKLNINLSERRLEQAEKAFLEFSDPAPPDFIDRLNPLFEKMGIKPPEIRVFPGFSGAFTNHNTILISSMVKDSLEPTATHEMGHLIFGDTGNPNKKAEYRADRFANYATEGKIQEFIKDLSENNRLFNEEVEGLRSTRIGKAVAYFKQKIRIKEYGTYEERIANLEKPLTEEEKSYFKDAIEKYNARMSSPLAQGAVKPVTEANIFSSAWEATKQNLNAWFSDSSSRAIAVSNAKEALTSSKMVGLGAFGAALATESARHDVMNGEYTSATAKLAGAAAGGACFAGAAVEAAPLLLVPVVGELAYGATVLGAGSVCAWAGHGLVTNGKFAVEDVKNIISPKPTNFPIKEQKITK